MFSRVKFQKKNLLMILVFTVDHHLKILLESKNNGFSFSLH